MNTAPVWINAKAADNSLHELSHELIIDGAMTLALG
jgi:hypothetical protein